MAIYSIISDSHRESIARQLERLLPTTTFDEPLRILIAAVRHAPSIELPELHRFRDARGQHFEISAWSQHDAQDRAEQEPHHVKPFTWESARIQWPGMPSVILSQDQGTDHP